MTSNKTYDVIYADPPWRYSFSKSNNRKIENQYPTMSTNEVCALSVPSKTSSVLYLWATAPKLLDALKVMEAWGFTYKTHAVWDKGRQGMGYWFRGQHELLLVGVRGVFSPPPQGQRRASVFNIQRDRHSKKPDAIRNLIVEWFPLADRLELFCREPCPLWDVWGNEVESAVTMGGT